MISIFAKPSFLNINPHEPFKDRIKPPRGHLMRVSSTIRGDQIAEQIGAKLNPEKAYYNDVCIYVKPMVRKDEDFNFEGKKSYLDIVDGHNLGQLMIKYPKVGVITCSESDHRVMSSILHNEVVFIPQHHCNFNRIRRNRNKVTTIGMIGTKTAIDFLPKGFEESLKKVGMKFLFFSDFFKREDIIDFYKKIDIQLIWRPYRKVLSNPLKLVNAASFGIPTIALNEPAFEELGNCYMPVKDEKEFFVALSELKKNKILYDVISDACFKKAENYHIEKVGKMYKELDK